MMIITGMQTEHFIARGRQGGMVDAKGRRCRSWEVDVDSISRDLAACWAEISPIFLLENDLMDILEVAPCWEAYREFVFHKISC